MSKPKYTRRTVGSVIKAKEPGKSDYIKIKDDVTFKRGDTLQLESAQSQLASLESAVQSGKLSGELAEKIRERIQKIPDFVRFDIVQVSKE